MNDIKRLYRYLKHCILARNTKGYGIHSPLLFHFTRFIVMERHPFYVFEAIEKERKRLLNDNSILKKQDYGTGKSTDFTVKNIAKRSLSSPRKAELLHRIVNHFDLDNQLELGTSFGISTAYMASASAHKRKCITLEGCQNTAKIASQVLSNLHLQQVEILVGNIDNTIQVALNKLSSVDFVLIDANHTFEATCNYFDTIKPYLSNKALIIIDDIYWSDEMIKEWEYVKNDKQVTATIDLFQFGIVFMNPELHKQNYKMRYPI